EGLSPDRRRDGARRPAALSRRHPRQRAGHRAADAGAHGLPAQLLPGAEALTRGTGGMPYAAGMGDARLETFLAAHRRLFVLTGAGCSTGSGIPDYRDERGAWKRTPPVTWQAFTGDRATRQRYWARSLLGW